jgi:hypothetical protein
LPAVVGGGDAESVTRSPLATSPFSRPTAPPPTIKGIAVGDRVTVDKFGMGRVTRVCPEQEIVCVDFGDGVIRHIAAGTKGFSRL